VRDRVPAPLAALLAAALVLGVAWAIISPPFQSPDENAHFGYAQTLAETGSLPGNAAKLPFSSEQNVAGSLSNADQAAAQRVVKMEWSDAVYEDWLRTDRDEGAVKRDDGGGLNPASSNPPLYYLGESLAYLVTSGSDLFGRLLAMRLVSVLWLLVTVAAVWALAGEVFARDRLLQLAAASVAALAPMMTFLSASVQPDGMLFATWSVALWLGVRILRRGVSARSAAALLATVGIAILAKAASYALLPGALLVIVVALRRRRTGGRIVPALAAVGGLAATLGTWFVVARVLDRPAAAQVASASASSSRNVREFFSYVWQFYLPRPPFMTDFPTVAHTIPVYDVWIKGAWASFGWTEVLFRNRVYVLLVVLMVVVVVLAASELWRTRAGSDKAIGLFLLVTTLALLAGLHWSEYGQLKAGASNFNQGRYLLPLVGIAGLVTASAVRRLPAGRRTLAVGGILGGFMVLQLFSLALVLTRFYA
jgi:4-amino-4-deoxy-L-arabinose transferase-like glycosyltransferase